jgi:hypothetical protein
MVKSTTGFSKNPAILFAMFLRRFHQRSIWHGHGANACLCFKTVTKTQFFFQEEMPPKQCQSSVYNHSNQLPQNKYDS